MKNVFLSAIAFACIAATACSGGNTNSSEKKVVVMASGEITVNGNTIKLDPSFRHNEQEVSFKGDKVSLKVESTDGKSKSFDLTENGIYVLNLQKDTLIGGLVSYGETGKPGRITEQELDRIIDSTQQLMQGLNASDAKGTYFLPPYTIKKISSKENTRIIGSFKGIPYKLEPDGSGNIPDVVKFFSNSQKRETLRDLLDQKSKIKEIH